MWKHANSVSSDLAAILYLRVRIGDEQAILHAFRLILELNVGRTVSKNLGKIEN